MIIEDIESYLSFRSEKLSAWRTILAGGTAGFFSWLVAMPADVLKSRLQSGKSEIIPRIYYDTLVFVT